MLNILSAAAFPFDALELPRAGNISHQVPFKSF
jgi:hypothetical protein